MDIAVRSPSDDKLGRWEFARSLATQIWDLPPSPEGYVVGLEAEWGAGKSSVINMALHQLLLLELVEKTDRQWFHGEDAVPIEIDEMERLTEDYNAIVGFGQPGFDLNYVHPDHYNRAIAERCGNNESDIKKLYRYFRLRMRVKAEPKNLIIHFRPWLIPDTAALSTVFLAELTKSVGGLLGDDVQRALRAYTEIISRLAPLAGVAAQAAVPGVGSLIKDFLVAVGQRKDPTLDERKSALERSLKSLGDKKVVIVVDDLDRLSPKEAAEMIALVKSLGNLPNVVYLLSYDSAVMASHIRKVLDVDGYGYLEKIVQYRRSLPLLAANALVELLRPAIEVLFTEVIQEVIDRYDVAVLLVAKRYILTPRDAVRASSWVAQAHARLRGQTDPVDLLILEILNAKDPELHSWIRRNIDILCNKETQETFKVLLERDLVIMNERRVLALSLLFPDVATEFASPHGRSSAPRSAKRLHIRDFSPAYFELSEPLTSFGKDVIARLFDSDDFVAQFKELLDVAETSPYASALRIDLLDSVRERMQLQDITRGILTALIESAPDLIRSEDRLGSDDFSPDNWRRLSGAIDSGLQDLSPEGREDMLAVALDVSEDISLVADAVRRALEHRPSEKPDKSGLSDHFKNRVLTRIREDALADKFRIAAHLPPILRLWSELDSRSIVRSKLDEMTSSRANFVGIVRMILTVVRSSAEGIFYQLIKEADEFVDIRALEKWALDAGASANPAERLWAARFQDAVARDRKRDF